MEKTMINKIQKILDTLPISYYLGGKLNKVSLTNDDASWFNPMTLEIGISFTQLENTKDFGKLNLEDDIRCMLYHEVSHAMLTPKCLTMTDKINIFEDERIETICKDYYMRTNFKQFVKRVNNFKDEAPKSAMELFYQIVRYRKGPKLFVEKVQNIIKKYKGLTYNTRKNDSVSDYENEINYLYSQVSIHFINNAINDVYQGNEKDNDDCSTMQFPDADINARNIDKVNKENNEIMPNDELSKLFKGLLDTYHNTTFKQVIKKILHQETSMEHSNGSAINAYTGCIDIRSCGRDDYKYFVRSNRQGNIKQFTKKKLNLFIDRSGSFCDSEQKVNELLFELASLEKEDANFSFDLITCGIGETYQNKNERTLKCRGGNKLDAYIFDLYKKVQDKQAKNYNIILFDGDAFSDCGYNDRYDYYKNFGAFNSTNCVIISDHSNMNAIDTYAKNAKRIFTKKYTEELEKNVEIALQSLIR